MTAGFARGLRFAMLIVAPFWLFVAVVAWWLS